MDSLISKTLRGATAKIAVILAGAFLAFAANATPLLEITSAGLTATDPTQLGRISRDGVPSDWSTSKTFPGVINPATSYAYHTYTLNVQSASFIQIIFDSLAPTTFISAYLGSYNPAAGLATNYLGDAGVSGNFFGIVDTGTAVVTDPLFFQVHVPTYSDLVLVINETSGVGAGLLQPFKILVEGFVDSEFTDIPEPGTLGLAALALLAFFMVRRRAARNAA